MSVSDGEPVRDAGRDEHARVVVLAGLGLAEIERLRSRLRSRCRRAGRAARRAPGRTARTSSRPGAGGSADRRCSRPCGRRGSTGSSRAPLGIHSRRYVSTNRPRSSRCTAGTTWTTPAITSLFRTRCHRYSRSTREWSPSIRRVAFGRSPLRTTSTSRPSKRIVNVVYADDPTAFEQHRVLDLRVAQLAVGTDRGVRTDVGVDEHGVRRR